MNGTQALEREQRERNYRIAALLRQHNGKAKNKKRPFKTMFFRYHKYFASMFFGIQHAVLN